MKTDRAMQRRATEILRKCGQLEAPVDVFAVAACLGAKVVPQVADPEISGALTRGPDGPVIGFNATHSVTRKRFTVAHECGHLVLHDQPYFLDRVFRRDHVSSEATDVFEIEANKFAAALLMPKAWLLEDLSSGSEILRSEDVEELARRYQVSQQAMTFRLENIGAQLDLS